MSRPRPRAAAAAALAAPLLLALALLLAAPPGARGYCGECHLVNDHTKDFATAQPDLERTACRHYAANACCTAEAAGTLFGLYGDAYKPNRCGELSPECNAWFEAEACLYECDVHAGRYRLHEDCTDQYGGDNSWQMFGMPIKASQVDAWYAACQDDLFCTCGQNAPCSEEWMSPGSFFALPGLNCTAETCLPFGDIYPTPKAFLEVLWDNAFVYQEDEANAYAMWPEIANMTNNDLNHTVEFPNTCNNETVLDECEVRKL